MNPVPERLLLLRELLRIEHEEDYRQYKAQFARDNINYRRENGVTWYPVVISNVEIGLGEYLVVDIERTTHHREPHQFSGGKNAALFSNVHSDAQPLTGTVKVLGPDKLRLTLSVDELPEWTEDGKLGLNLLFDEASYREMDAALERVIAATKGDLARLRDVLYAIKKPSFRPATDHDLPMLNESQRAAVSKVLSADDIAVIHGPPGTGKTTTLVQAIKLTLQSEQQVLVCSSSNTAVDLLTEKLHREGLVVLRLGNPARIAEEVLSSTLDARMLQHPNFRDLKSYRKTAEEYFRMAGKYKRTFGREEREQRQLLYAEARKILADARHLEDHIQDEQFRKAQVIACTPVVAAGRLMRDRQFGTVFIDEAAQALEPMCWIPIARSRRVIFAGDHFQLPPTVKSREADARGLKETLFERAVEIPGAAEMLQTQYRMNKTIMGFSSHAFYQDRLIAAPQVAERLLTSDPDNYLLAEPFTFVDTAGAGFSEILNPESLSISNPEEAAMVLRCLHLMLRQYGSGLPLSIGVISPYKEQVTLLERLVAEDEELQAYGHRIAVKTIDGFQGQERDMILISMVRSNDSQTIGFLEDTRRMNVALTRAKSKLLVAGDSATIGTNPFYREFLDYVEKNASYRSAWEFMDQP